jgi:hypothetical protein
MHGPRLSAFPAPGLFLFLALSLAAFLPLHADAPRLSGISLGFGDWITVTDGDAGTREDYGTLPSAAAYFSGWGWSGSIGVPVKSASKRIGDKTRYSLGDGEVSAGRRLGSWTPRVSLKFPLYAWSVEDAAMNELYIGSGTVDLGAGLGGRLPPVWLPRRLSVQFDLEASAAMIPGLADIGSFHGLGVLQATHALGKRGKAGVNALFLYDRWVWIPTYWDQEKEINFSIVPGVVAGFRLFRATYVDAKAGMSVFEHRILTGPKYPERPRQAYAFGLSLYQGFR